MKRSEILSLREEFPLNIYAVGQVTLKRNKSTTGENLIKFSSKSKMNENSEVRCNECSDKKADCSCQQCKTELCSDCFTAIHSISVTLRKHEKISLKEMATNQLFEENLCNNHKGLFMNIYCKDCEIYMCKECSIEKHLEHCCTDVFQLNKPKFPEFSGLFDEANDVLKHLYATKKKMQQLGSRDHMSDEGAKKVEEQVQLHFSYLHGMLQRQEEELLRKIRFISEETQKSLQSISVDLEKNIKEVENILSLCTRTVDTMIKELPLDCLLEKLRNIAATPCHLVLNNGEDDSKFELYVDPQITETLKTHCTVNIPTKVEYELCSKFELPESYQVEDLKDATEPFLKPDLLHIKTVKDKEESCLVQQALLNAIDAPSPPQPQTEAKAKPQDFLRKNHTFQQRKSLSGSLGSVSSQESYVDKMCNVEPLVEGQTEIVRMSHFLTPSNFYVQRKCNLFEIEKIRNYFAKNANRNKNPPTKVEFGQLYLVKYSSLDRMWYRARVTKIDGNLCDIFYVDYGNVEQKVTINNLRYIPDRYAEIPDQAIHCGLYNCVPKEGRWNPKANSIVTNMAINSDLSMYIERINRKSGYHEVYLRKIDDEVGSLSDALVYCGYATAKENKKNVLFKQPSVGMRKKGDFKDTVIKEKEVFDGRITHINSPTNFYMQKIADTGELLMNMMTELSATYSKYSPNEGLIFTPVIGMPVAAKFQNDGSWYRATILRVPDTRKVEVKYVDFGNVSVIDIGDIRELQNKFLRIGAQALKCSLNDIAPKHPRGWPSSAKTVFENLIVKKGGLLRVWVAEVKDDNSLSVVLYETTPTKYININGVLVKKRHAISTGQTSAQAEYECRPEYEVKIQQELMMSDSESDCTELSVTTKTSEDSISKMNKLQSEPSEETPDQEIDGRLKVQVLKVISPSEVYVSHVNTPKLINKLIKEMTTFYMSQAQVEEERDWTPGDLCAVLKPADNKWYRGVITEGSHNNFKVFIKDIVEMVSADKSELRSLEQKFYQVQDGSIKVHLWGVKEPGGMKVWPASTTDYMRQLLGGAEAIYIEEVGNIVNNSLPVRFWRRTQKQAGPLEPLRDEWCNVNISLISMGLALKDAAAQEKAPNSTTAEPNDNYVIGWLHNSFQSVQELQNKKITVAEVAAETPHVSTFVEEERLPVKTINPTVRRSHTRSNRGRIPSQRANYIPGIVGSDDLDKVKEWPPAVPFSKLNFVAIPSYVDFDCNIYVQDAASESTLELLEKAFMSLFDKSEKRPYEEEFFEGQICVAFFQPNKKWYRAKVLKVKPEHIEVLFVDYGNVEELQPDELRKQATMGHIPIQCHKCRTDGIIPVSPDGSWPIRALDFIHSTIVDKKCEINLKAPTGETCADYIILSLKLPGGQDLLETLMSMHYATYVIDCETVGAEDDKSIIEEQQLQISSNIQASKALALEIQNVYSNFEMPTIQNSINNEEVDVMKSFKITQEDCSNSIGWFEMIEHAADDPPIKPGFITELDTTPRRDLQFKELILPDSMVEFSVEVQIVSSHNSLKVVILNCEDPEITAFLNEFAGLHVLMQEEAESLPTLTFPVKDLVCIGCYTDDDTWYRAVIKNVFPDENMVTVLYVDYGNVEKIPVTRLREIKPEWTLVPVQAFHVTLHNVREGPNYDAATCHASLMSCFMDPPYTMSIETRFPKIEVEIYNKEGVVAYNPCIDSGLISKD